jgi:hypothetical protein
MGYPLGTVLASPVVGGSASDTYGTHYSYLGIGGWQEFDTIADRNAIPVDALGNLDASGLSSGRRRLGMLVFVNQIDSIFQLFVPYNNWTGMTNSQKVAALANNANWVPFAAAGSGDATKKKYQQVANGFSVGDVISFNGTQFVKGIANAGNTLEFLGMVSSIIDPDNFILTYSGFIDTTPISGLSANTLYYVSPINAGKITPIEPFNPGESSRPILITQTPTSGLVLNDRGFIVSSSSSGSTGSGLRIQRTTTQTAHGFALGDVIFYSGTSYHKAIASGTTGLNEFPIGVVNQVISPNSFIVCFAGYIDGMSPALDYTGTHHLSGSTLYYLSPTVAGKLTNVKPTSYGQIVKPMYQAFTTDDGVVANQLATPVSSASGATGVIGPAKDANGYTDGIFNFFVPSTPIGTAIDYINELLLVLSPPPAPSLTTIGKNLFPSGALSFGVSRNSIGYTNVTTAAGNSAVDINGTYAAGGTRLGITGSVPITETLNFGIVSGSSYPANAFGNADQGRLDLYLNGVLFNSLPLSGTTGSTTNGVFTVSAVHPVHSPSGQPVTAFKYRTGTFTISSGSFVTGFNYVRVIHVTPSTSFTSNFSEWVYDSNTNALALSGATTFSSLNLTGSKFMSGVKYSTGGTVNFNALIQNVYKNTYANGNVISYPSRVNLSDATSIVKTGAGLVAETNANKNLPLLNSGVTNPQNSLLSLVSTHTLQNNILGNSNGIQIALSIPHPIKATLTTTVLVSNGYLQYTPSTANVLNTENFTGEVNRLQAQDYSLLTYANVNSGLYAWDSTQSLVGGNALYNTGLLRFNGELMYPNAAYLLSQYSIASGNFTSVTNALAGNPNYSTASGTRSDYRKFTSANAVTQSTVSINILTTGTVSSFLTNGGTGGSPSGNFIKLEFLIMRSNGEIHGWFNPFASSGNPEGVANTSATAIAGGVNVTCTLSTTPRIGNGDIVVIRVFAASGWTNRISNISITNI